MGSVIFLVAGAVLERISLVGMIDFKAVYYATRCLIEHGDPYREQDLQRVYLAEDSAPQARKLALIHAVIPNVNLPSTLLFVMPLAWLPWGPAHLCWMLLTGGGFLFAAYLIWEMGADYAPVLSGALLCIFLATSAILLEVGNAAGLVVSLSMISVWCFLRRRFTAAGLLCLAVGLLIKPQDAGFVWLYFLLAGGIYRKRALQTLLLAAILALPSLICISLVAPHWLGEMRTNLSLSSQLGGGNDPGPTMVDPRARGAILITLQTVLSVFKDDARFYNPLTDFICWPLLLAWVYITVRRVPLPSDTWMALAAIAALSMLPIYHRQHDTRLLLLMVPACAMLWTRGGAIARMAVAFTVLGSIFTSDITMRVLATSTAGIRSSVGGWPGTLLTVLLCRPAPLILLATGLFYLWVYARRSAGETSPGIDEVSAPRAMP